MRIELFCERLELRLAKFTAVVAQEIGEEKIDDVFLDCAGGEFFLIDSRLI
jgi:hypothetical protein